MAVYPERRSGKLTGVWVAETTAHGERRRKRFPTKHEAERWADYCKLTGAPPPGDAPVAPVGHTLGSVMVEALANHPGWERNRDAMREPRLRYALEVLGADTPIDKLATTDLHRLITSLKKRPGKSGKLAPGTINRYVAGVSTLLEFARDCGYLGHVIHVPWQKEAGQRPHWLTEEQEAAICKVLLAQGLAWHELIVRVLCATGMRWGELETLKPAQICFSVNNPVSANVETTAWVKLDVTKTDTTRDIPIEPKLAEKLQELVANHLVPPYERMRIVFKRAVISAGQNPELSLHCLRHTTATRLVLADVNLATVQRFMGHSNVKTTLKYVKLVPQSLQDALKKLSPRAGQSAV